MSERPVVFVHSSDELYGADRILLDMVAALPDPRAAQVWLPTDQDRHALCVELTHRSVEYRHIDLPIMRRAYRRPRELAKLVGRMVRVVPMFVRARPSVVVCTTSAALLAAPAARIARVPLVNGHLQEVWSAADRKILAPLARCCHRLTAVSTRAAEAVSAQLRGRVVVVPNATPEPSTWSTMRGRTGSLTFVVASRWGAGKGHGTLLRAWDALRQPAGLTILGGPPERGASVDVEKLVAESGRPSTVKIVGEVRDAASYIDAADVVLVPSDYPEGFGLVAIEAFARGRPVVASSAGGLADIVHDGVDGWLYPPRDSAALAAILNTLDRETVHAAGAHAREAYERRYTSAVFGRRWRSALGCWDESET